MLAPWNSICGKEEGSSSGFLDCPTERQYLTGPFWIFREHQRHSHIGRKNVADVEEGVNKALSRSPKSSFPRKYCSPRRTIKQILPDGHNGGQETMHAQGMVQCSSCSLWLYRRRCGSRSLMGCGLLRSYSGVYLGSSPIRGSGAVLAGKAIPDVTGEEKSGWSS